MKTTILLVLASLLLFTGCKMEDLEDIPDPVDYLVVFEYNFVNDEAAYTNQGWYILPNGEIWAYNTTVDWKIPGDNSILTLSELESNLAKTTVLSHTVDQESLFSKHKTLIRVKDNDITEKQSDLVDVGVPSLYGFYKLNDNEYFRVTIRRTGELDRTRQGSEVTGLLNYLTGIGEEIGGFIWY